MKIMNTQIIALILTSIGQSVIIVGFTYLCISNLKKDLCKKFDKKENINEIREKFWDETNKRMDGVYHLLLKKMSEEIK